MSSSSAFAAFRLGVRLEQLAGLRELPESDRIDRTKAALWERLVVAAAELRDEEGPFGVVSASIRASQELLTQFLYSRSTGEREHLFATIQSYANNWKSELASGTSRPQSNEFAMWFELGVEVANGTDDYSPGKPAFQADGIKQVFVFVDPRPHKWNLSNRERVEQLIRRLDISWEDVFRQPDAANRIDDFDELPEDLSWPWCNIENALRSLAVRLALPVWNDHDRTLTVRGEVVRRFQNPAPKQMQIIQAFVDKAWERTALCPFGKPEVRRQTLEDLNESIDPKYIFFGGTGDGRLRWSFTNPAQPE